MKNEEPKFNVDLSKVVFEMGVILHMKWEPKNGYALFREFKDIKGVPYHVWKDSDEYYLVNMTDGNTLKHFNSAKAIMDYYFGNYDPSKPEG